MNFKYLIDNDISLYCESEEERAIFLNISSKYNKYGHVSLTSKDRYFTYDGDYFKGHSLVPDSGEVKHITFTDWKNIGVNDMEEINLETHIGKVNDNRLYEFSDDRDFIGIPSVGVLVYISRNRRYFMFSNLGERLYSWKYCRLYKEPEEKKNKEDIIREFRNEYSKLVDKLEEDLKGVE